MQVLVAYDISNDKERERISDICLDFGLERIQHSVFLGELNRKLRQMLAGELKANLPRINFDLRVFKIDGNSKNRRLIFGAATERAGN